MTKRKIQNSEISNKKTKIEQVHPISLVFNYINDPYEFHNGSLVCKSWQQALDTHKFWEEHIDSIGIESPKAKAKKYKTCKSVFVKNADKLCVCKQDFGITNKQIEKIYFKLLILVIYCINRNNFYDARHCNELIIFAKEKLENLKNKSENSK
jgi:hypothetical protein